MASSSSTPNFSRPFPSPLSTSALDTPVRGSRARDIFSQLPRSASFLNISHRTIANAGSPSRRLFDLDTSHDHKFVGHADMVSPQISPRKHHGRPLSRTSIASTSDSYMSHLSNDLGGLEKPIPSFRPHLWRHLDRQREALNLDLFWPVKLEEDGINDSNEPVHEGQGIEGEENGDDEHEEGNSNNDRDHFPYRDLKPLLTFHKLRFLQLNGMMRSYQPLIWATCWINKNLTTLHLEMGLEPEMRETPLDLTEDKATHRRIDSQWVYNPRAELLNEHTEYLGFHGQGRLHEEFGYGEYLDQQAMRGAQLMAAEHMSLDNLRYLPIRHLTLRNFVVDAGPFFKWFDPKKLQEISFLGDCIDAGFFLPDDMKFKVKVNRPPMPARLVASGEVKVVSNKGKGVGGVGGRHEQNAGAGAGGGSGSGSSTLKIKISQIIPKWGHRVREREIAKDDGPGTVPEQSQVLRKTASPNLHQHHQHQYQQQQLPGKRYRS